MSPASIPAKVKRSAGISLQWLPISLRTHADRLNGAAVLNEVDNPRLILRTR